MIGRTKVKGKHVVQRMKQLRRSCARADSLPKRRQSCRTPKKAAQCCRGTRAGAAAAPLASPFSPHNHACRRCDQRAAALIPTSLFFRVDSSGLSRPVSEVAYNFRRADRAVYCDAVMLDGRCCADQAKASSSFLPPPPLLPSSLVAARSGALVVTVQNRCGTQCDVVYVGCDADLRFLRMVFWALRSLQSGPSVGQRVCCTPTISLNHRVCACCFRRGACRSGRF